MLSKYERGKDREDCFDPLVEPPAKHEFSQLTKQSVLL